LNRLGSVECDNDLLISLVGTGIKKEYCGKVKKYGTCDHDHEVSKEIQRLTCKDRSCPVCYPVWVTRNVQNSGNRIFAWDYLTQYMYGKKISTLDGIVDIEPDITGHEKAGITRHWTFSPSQKWAIQKSKTKSGFRSMRRELNSLLVKAGMNGAVVIYHHWRHTKLAKDEFAIALRNGDRGTDKGIHHWIRLNGFHEDIDYYYVGPHFHIIGKGFLISYDEFIEFSKKKKNPGGWIYWKISDLMSKTEVNQCLNYALSHCAIVEGFKSITYMGEISVRSMKGELHRKDSMPSLCPHCTENVYEVFGYDEELRYDDQRGVELFYPVFTENSNRIDTMDLMEYIVETWGYYFKSHSQFVSFQRRGDRVTYDKGKSHNDLMGHEDNLHAFDHVSRKWYDENGEVVV